MKNFSLKPTALIIATHLGLLAPSVAVAQEEQTNENVETIEIKGFKGSLLRSLDNKKLNSSISDSIFAEDIGKSADQDIGEALQRVTGVSIQRGGGAGANSNEEGTTVSVRGAGPNLNNISLNGVILTSSTENQAVDLSAYSSDILSSIEVIKTASADQDEGSLGANVLLKTFKPLSATKDKRVIEVQGRYDNFADETDYKLSGSFSKKFLDDSLGFYITGFKETQAQRKDMFATNRLEIFTAPQARDSETNEILTDVTGYMNGQNGFTLFQNKMERSGFTTTLQYLVSEDTDVQLTATWSDQYRETDDNTIVSLGSKEAINPNDPVLNEADPWIVFNQDNQFFEKKLDRLARGRTARLQSGVETENRIYSLELNHYFTDNFKMSLRGGYSKTLADDDYYSYLNSNNYVHVDDENLIAVPSDVIQPTGYDCTSGQCRIVTGDGLVDFGPGQSGEIGEPSEDNTVYTGYNPDDLDATHLQQAVSRDRLMQDKQQSFYADFDWDIDFDPITQIEFGVKYQKREKSVVNEEFYFEGVPQPLGIETPGIAVDSIRLSEVTDGQLEVDDFMAELGYPRDNNTDGWYTVNARKAFAKIFANDNVKAKPNLTADRAVDQTNLAYYVKANYTLMDDFITGNFGVRYVSTDISSAGYSGIDFQNNNVIDRNLAIIAMDSSLPACTEAQLASPAGDFDENGNWGPAAGQSCYDENFDFTPDNRIRYVDSRRPEDPAQFPVKASNKTNNLLPSLTANFNISDEFITRFAVSKTMARPKIDSLKPSYSYREFVWGGDSVGNISNPYLEALESKNLDLAFEWYFNQGGALTTTFFYKRMSNFEESETIQAYWKDLRQVNDEELQTLDPINDILTPRVDGDLLTPENSQGCLPTNRHIWQSVHPDTSKECDRINVNRIRNGKGATNKGIEIGYNQNYDFLPGVWSGLGSAINYTFSDSKTDAESGTLSGKLSSLPMANISKHTFNLSTFWEQEGNLIRLAYNYRTDSLANRSFNSGALWNEGGGRLDLSATYKLNEQVTLTFNAVNLTDLVSRQYYTNLKDDRVEIEGNALEGNANKSRTIREWNTGTIYRIGVRASF